MLKVWESTHAGTGSKTFSPSPKRGGAKEQPLHYLLPAPAAQSYPHDAHAYRQKRGGFRNRLCPQSESDVVRRSGCAESARISGFDNAVVIGIAIPRDPGWASGSPLQRRFLWAGLRALHTKDIHGVHTNLD